MGPVPKASCLQLAGVLSQGLVQGCREPGYTGGWGQGRNVDQAAKGTEDVKAARIFGPRREGGPSRTGRH